MEKNVLATSVLHNFLRNYFCSWQPDELNQEVIPTGNEDMPGVEGNSRGDAFDIREKCKEFFISPQGRVYHGNANVFTKADILLLDLNMKY